MSQDEQICNYKSCIQPTFKGTRWCKACHSVIWTKWRGSPPDNRVKRPPLEAFTQHPADIKWEIPPFHDSPFAEAVRESTVTMTSNPSKPEEVTNLTFVANSRIFRCIVRYASFLVSALGVIAKLWPRAR